MNLILKRVGLFSLALLLLAGSVLHYPFYAFALNQVKCEMQQEMLGIHQGKTIDLVLAKEAFGKARVEEEELCIDNNWYDIVSVSELKDGSVAVKCFSDSHESLLHAWLNKVTNDNSDNSASPVKNGKSAAVSPEYVSSASHLVLPVDQTSASVSFSEKLAGLLAGHTLLPELPPRA